MARFSFITFLVSTDGVSFLFLCSAIDKETERMTMMALNHGPRRATSRPKYVGKLMPLLSGLIIGFMFAYQILPREGGFTDFTSSVKKENCDSDCRNNEKSKEGDKLTAAVPHSYRLAYEQSMGFFDDIPETQWKELYQRRARNATNHLYRKKPLRDWQEPAIFYLKNYEPTFTCPHVRRIGGVGELKALGCFVFLSRLS
jgi:hypothetical protein